MNFQNEKSMCLRKLRLFDKSRKGSVDKEICALVSLINSFEGFYTTSSCAGRIQLLCPAKEKHQVEWIYTSHNSVSPDEILPFLSRLPKKPVWLRMEPPIIHVCCSSLEAADWLLKKANSSGLRRCAAISLYRRLIVEITCLEKIDSLIAEQGKLLVSMHYIESILRHANSRLEKSREKIKKLELSLQEHCKKDKQH